MQPDHAGNAALLQSSPPSQYAAYGRSPSKASPGQHSPAECASEPTAAVRPLTKQCQRIYPEPRRITNQAAKGINPGHIARMPQRIRRALRVTVPRHRPSFESMYGIPES